MGARTVLIVAGYVGGLAWVAKVGIMLGQDGPDPDSVPETIAFVVGALGVLVASAAAGAYLTRSSSTGRRVLGAGLALLAVAAFTGVGQLALIALPGDGWLWEEAIFGVTGLLAVVAATVALRQPADDLGAEA